MVCRINYFLVTRKFEYIKYKCIINSFQMQKHMTLKMQDKNNNDVIFIKL